MDTIRLAKGIAGSAKRYLRTAFHTLANGIGWRSQRLYNKALYRITSMHRRRLRRTLFVGVTGSSGKTTAKDLIASVLERHLSKGRKNPGSLNWPEDMVRVVLGTRKSDAYCVAEISTHGPGMMDLPLALVQPTVGVVTNIGADHFSAFHSRDAIAEEKGKLIQSLPPTGIAILNADDPRVLAMRSRFSGRTVTYGLAEDAMLRGEAVQSIWPNRLSLTAIWNGESVQVQTKLCGTHWTPAVLAALATGVALDVPLAEAAEAIGSVEPFEGRMAPVIVDGITFIRDDWKAPLMTVEPAFEFMRQAAAPRKIIVIGTLSDYQGDSTRRYVETGQLALTVADCVVFVGPRASAALRAKRGTKGELRAFSSLRDASVYLADYLKPGDLVLFKGSHKADHMHRLILARTTEVKCWRGDCGRQEFCDTCELLHVPSGPQTAEERTSAAPTDAEPPPGVTGMTEVDQRTVIVVGLGNPEEGRVDTPHNVGYRAVDILSERLGQNWVRERDLAMIARGELNGTSVCLIKTLVPMNDIGPVLFRLSRDFDFDVQQCILVHDDLDLQLGVVRARMRGSDGGHRGVRSILQSFQDDKFRRVKIGIGQAEMGQPVHEYVLAPFPPDQLPAVGAALELAANRVVELVRRGNGSAIS